MKRSLRVGVILAIVAADQATKHLARIHLRGSGGRQYIAGALTLMYSENPGGFLSLGAAMPANARHIFFDLFIPVAVAAGLCAFLGRGVRERSEDLVFAVLLGGAIGNIVDRFIFSGYVTDFLFVSIGPLHTGIFNLADMAITFAAAWLFLRSVIAPPGPPRNLQVK